MGSWYGRVLTEVLTRTEDRGPSSVSKMFIIWPNKKAREQKHNFTCFPARAQAFSWLSSVTGL